MSEDKGRKATDVLLELEAKIDNILALLKSQDFNLKLLSNKISTIESSLKDNTPKYQISSEDKFVDDSKEEDLVDPEFSILQENFPATNRRGTRNDISPYPAQKQKKESSIAEVIVNPSPKIINKNNNEFDFKEYDDSLRPDAQIPVNQKLVDSKGKAVYLADVEIRNIKSNKVDKTRTNMRGIWMYPLAIGTYEVTIYKKELSSNNKKQIKQKLVVDGTQAPLNLEETII